MITILTTAKPFVGKTKSHQMNALRSWKALSADVEIILFGQGEGYAEAARELGLLHASEVETSERGTPLVNAMFEFARQRARYPVQAYVNCDIILLDDFPAAVERITLPRFLLVGQRWDLEPSQPLDVGEPGWQDRVRGQVLERGLLHPAEGSDFFVYKGYLWEDLPTMVVGRAGYDNALIFHCRVAGWPVIDVSRAVTVVHQSHDYSHHPQGSEGVWWGDEARQNWRFAEAPGVILTLVDADWRLTENGLERNRAGGNWERYIEVWLRVRRRRFAGRPAGLLMRVLLRVFLLKRSVEWRWGKLLEARARR